LFFYTITPLHPGSGASVAGVDLPIQRERHTNFPMIQASGVKGALRDLAEKVCKDEEKIKIVFGPKTEGASEHGGALAFTDARVLLFPVRSACGVFAWVTCKSAIERLKRDIFVIPNVDQREKAFTEIQEIELPDVLQGQAVTPPNAKVTLNDKVILEDFCFTLSKEGQDKVGKLAAWLGDHAFPIALRYWREKLKGDHALILLSEDDFRRFVEMSTEVITRVQLGETGTVAAGPWDEEHLPSETLLYSLALATDPKLPNSSIPDAQGVIKFLKDDLLEKVQAVQFGGDETVGKGLVFMRFLGGGEVHAAGPKQ